MFHIGHLNILKRAKEEYEHLIVGVSTDELAKSYKNKTPIIPYEERAEIVKAIKYVDEVVPQISRDKMEAYERIRFNAMFVGDDWEEKTFWVEVEKKLKEKGVDVVYFPYTKHISSTILREKLDKIN